VGAQWRDPVKRGDIPGAYWAVLTHPATTQALVKRVFGEVHMLSHLVGAANQADIRRLCDLDQRNAELEAKPRRQRDALRQAIVTRDASIDDLRRSLRERQSGDVPVANADDAALRALVADLEKRHAAESHRRVAVEARLADTREDLARERAARVRVEAGATSLRAELAAIATELRPENEAASWRVDRLSQLYVGGRPTQIAGLRALSEDRGAAAP
jgi:chromosome segregation ATPase